VKPEAEKLELHVSSSIAAKPPGDWGLRGHVLGIMFMHLTLIIPPV
jgi:hypothetical protein